MIKKYIYLFLILLQFTNTNSYSQTKTELKEKNLSIISEIEKKFNVSFYYEEFWLENSKLNDFTLDLSLKETLESSFKNSSLKYFLYQDKYVILTYLENLDLSNGMISFDNNVDAEVEYTISDNDILIEELKKEESRIFRIGAANGGSGRVLLTGNIAEVYSGMQIEGVAVIADDGKIGTTTDRDGNYKIVLSKGYHVINYQHVAMVPAKRQVELYSSGRINVKLMQKVTELGEVRVLAEDERKEREVIGFEALKAKEFSELPSFMGEVDIIKHSLLLPGIQSAGEGDMSFSVRGGKGDQNLILLEGMHTYSYSHFFGFFPSINPNTINKANLYKASLPVEFGNRISSVYDIILKNGDFKKLNIDGGVSPITANVAIDGPIIKDKLSFSIGGRGTYSNWVINSIDVQELQRSKVDFYDYQAKINYKINENSSLSAFYYNSYDYFSLHTDTSFYFKNQIGSLIWDNVINDKLTVSTILGYTKYANENTDEAREDLATKKEQVITDYKINTKFDYQLTSKHEISPGFELIYTQLKPWSLTPLSNTSTISPIDYQAENAYTGALYFNDRIDLTNSFSVDLGVRYAFFYLAGPYEEYLYQDDILSEVNIIDTVVYSSGDKVHFDSGLEYRISGTYKLNGAQNLNFCYNRNRQYIHTLTNTQGATPVDSWQLSNKYIEPQIADHFSIGYNADLRYRDLFLNVDAYYKDIKNIKDFINGSDFEFNSHPETEIVNAKGKSYGLELMLKKDRGRLSGWLSYTYSRTLIKSKSEIARKNINNGEWYPASNDKPHNVSAVINLKPTRRLVVSNVFNYSTGTPITLPVSMIKINDTYSIIYSERNEYRMPDYFRWDISLSFKGSLKKKKIRSTWTFSIYNVTGRKNAYSIYFKNQDNNIQGYKLSIFGEPIPTLTYKFNF
jgi:CarboxypepD_reg-like domain